MKKFLLGAFVALAFAALFVAYCPWFAKKYNTVVNVPADCCGDKCCPGKCCPAGAKPGCCPATKNGCDKADKVQGCKDAKCCDKCACKDKCGCCEKKNCGEGCKCNKAKGCDKDKCGNGADKK